METVPHNSLLLIAVIPSPKDLQIARMLGWYRIPLKFAPKIIDVDYLAFYQGSNFGEEHRWRIEYLAECRGHELTTRCELLRNEMNHPRAKEEYYKVQLGPLIKVPEAVKAEKWKRITFLYTTGELFNRARCISDLVMRSDDKVLLWKAIRERTQQRSQYNTMSQPDITIDPSVLDEFLNLDPITSSPDPDNLQTW